MVSSLRFVRPSLTSVLDPDAKILAMELDGLPLALATAGTYLDQAATSCSDYLRLYKASWAKLQKTSPELSSYEDRTLYSTWQISFHHVKQRNEFSAKLLRLWAYFDSRDLWFELLRHGDLQDPEWIRELTEDELSFNAAVRALCDHGLVEADSSSQEEIESRGYSIHGCVHSWTIHVLNQEWDYDLARLALKFVGLHVPGRETDKWWLTQRRLLQHAARCSYIVLNSLVADDGMEWAFHSLGDLYAAQGKLNEAEKMYQRALQGKEKVWGPDHTSTLDTVNNLGNLYRDQGKLADSEKMHQRAQQGREKVLGPEHASTLDSVHSLGILHRGQGKLADAEKMFQRALQGYEKTLGPEHTSTLLMVNNFGSLYGELGKLADAEKMYQRALQGYEKALGPEHTSTLLTVNNLGNLYRSQGKLADAEKMYQRALQGREKALGPEHTSTLDSVHSLGVLYRDQGKLEDAENMYHRALQGYEKTLGPEHTSTLNSVHGLGNLYRDHGKLADAEKMYQRALQGYEKALGPEHTSTLSMVNNLGSLYRDQGKLADAEKMFQRVLQEYEKALGLEHISTRNAMYKLYDIYFQRCMALRQEQTVRRRSNIASSHKAEDLSDVIVGLTNLCDKFGMVWPFLFSFLGRVLVWAGREEHAVVAFMQQLRLIELKPEHSSPICDSCGKQLNAGMKRFVCKACMDIDLCGECFENYEIDGLLLHVSPEICQAHPFLAVPGEETRVSEDKPALQTHP